MDSPKIKMVTKDEKEFDVEWEVFRMFGMFAPQDDPKDCPAGPIPLPEILSSSFEKILEYCEQHKHDPPLSEDQQTRGGSYKTDWDKEFVSAVSQEMLFEIILASNYLSIKPLLDLGCSHVSELIKGRTPEQIRQLFNIVNEFTAEEEAQIRRENEWAEDR